MCYLFAPFILILYVLFLSPGYWLALAAWIVSFFPLRKLLKAYFKDLGESWL